MDRRSFLKGLAAAFAAPIIAKAANLVPPEAGISETTGALFSGEIGSYENVRFIESNRYGQSLVISTRGMDVPSAVKKCVQVLLDDARQFLPSGTRFEIIDAGEFDYGSAQRLAWHYNPGGYYSPIGRVDPLRGLTVICEAVA